MITSVPEQHPDIHLKTKVDASLKTSIKEGAMAQMMLTIVDTYLTPFALFLNASPQQIGLLVAIPQLLGSISQLVAVPAVRFAGSRLKFLIYGCALQALTLIPLAFLAFTPETESHRLFYLVALISIFRVLGTLIGPAWGSLVSDYLPDHKRGHYFGRRAQTVVIAGIVSTLLWGVALYYFKKVNVAWGFFTLFLFASLFRFVSCYFMSKMEEVPLTYVKEDQFTFWMFIRRYKESNFVKYAFYVSSITFATYVAAPYFSVLMLRDLHFNYLNYMLISLSGMVASLITYPIWGRHADMVGNARILKVTSLLVPFIPFLWLFSRNPYVLTVIEFGAGFVWGGFNLCTTNFIYDAVAPSKRVRVIGYFNLINGFAIFFGSALGGYLAERLPPVLGYSLYTLFIISGCLRFLANLVFAKHFKEVRTSVKHVSSVGLLSSVFGIRPFINPAAEEKGA